MRSTHHECLYGHHTFYLITTNQYTTHLQTGANYYLVTALSTNVKQVLTIPTQKPKKTGLLRKYPYKSQKKHQICA